MQTGLHIAEMLEDLLANGNSLMLIRGSDGIYSGNIGLLRRCTSETLESCLEGLTGKQRTKVCIRDGCIAKGSARPLSCFSKDKDSRDGYSNICRMCESDRIKSINRRKKLRLAAGHQSEVVESLGNVEAPIDREV